MGVLKRFFNPFRVGALSMDLTALREYLNIYIKDATNARFRLRNDTSQDRSYVYMQSEGETKFQLGEDDLSGTTMPYITGGPMGNFNYMPFQVMTPIGAWNMNFSAGGDQQKAVTNPVPSASYVAIAITGFVRSDSSATYRYLPHCNMGSGYDVGIKTDWTQGRRIEMDLPATSAYDSTAWDDPTINRGALIVSYIHTELFNTLFPAP